MRKSSPSLLNLARYVERIWLEAVFEDSPNATVLRTVLDAVTRKEGSMALEICRKNGLGNYLEGQISKNFAVSP